MAIDPIANFLTIIRNGIAVSKPFVKIPYSKIVHRISEILKDEGFIRDFAVETVDGRKFLTITLKYVKGESAIHEIKRISTPGKRVYRGIAQVPPVIGGLGVTILTTNKGVITHKQARALNVGGEIICTVW